MNQSDDDANHDHPELVTHEIKLRLLEERFDDIEALIYRVDDKLNRIIWYVLCSLVIPIFMKFYNLV